jgi:hypothetical protein
MDTDPKYRRKGVLAAQHQSRQIFFSVLIYM